MNHKELVDQVFASCVRPSGKMESRRSCLAMRIYLEQLDSVQLKDILKKLHNLGSLFIPSFLNY